MAATQDIHEDIENWLAAAVLGQLSEQERGAFEEHLASCAACRDLYAEEKTMSEMIENTLGAVRPDLAFEQRIVSGFRRNVLTRSSLTAFLMHLWHNRVTQAVALAAILLSLVQMGRLVTGEDQTPTVGFRQLPSFVGRISTENDSVGSEGTEEPKRKRSVARGGSARSADPASQTLADAAQSVSVEAAAPLPPSAPSAGIVSQSAPQSMKAAAPADQEMAMSADMPAEAEPGEPNQTTPVTPETNRKLVRNAEVELEIVKFDDAVQKIIAFAAEDRGYVATSSSEKQANGKLQGQVIVKVLPENLDRFLSKLRGLGEVKNQTLGTEDVTKQYFDTDSRLNNARVMEQRLIDILKTKSNKVADLLEVEKELGRVRQQIEEMQGALKYLDAQVQFATVTITLAEKDLNEPAAFLLKRRARLALFSTDVEKTFAEVKSVIEGAKAQLSSSTLDRDSSGEATARLVLLIVPEEADALIDRVKGMGRVQNYTEQTDRVAQGGSGMSQAAKVERDKVELSVTISRNEQEPALQTTSLRILTSAVSEKTARLKENAAKANAEIRSSSFSRDPDGQEIANVTLRVAMKNYAALLSSFNQLGKVKDVSVQREERRGVANEETAPADISIQVYSQPDIVSDETGLFATIRRTLAQGAAALMWSLRMIGVALAFLAPWALALALVVWVLRKLARRRRAKPE